MPKPKKHNKTLFEFDAIGTHWWCESLEDNCVFDNKLATALLQRAAQFDADYTRFADTGYIGQLNKTGVVHHAPKELIDMLAFAKELYEASEGAFNISVGGALHAAGYGAPQRTARIWVNPWPDIVVKKSTYAYERGNRFEDDYPDEFSRDHSLDPHDHADRPYDSYAHEHSHLHQQQAEEAEAHLAELDKEAADVERAIQDAEDQLHRTTEEIAELRDKIHEQQDEADAHHYREPEPPAPRSRTATPHRRTTTRR